MNKLVAVLLVAVSALTVSLSAQAGNAYGKAKKQAPPPVVVVDVATQAAPIVEADTQKLLGYSYTITQPTEFHFTIPAGTWDVSDSFGNGFTLTTEWPMSISYYAVEGDAYPYTITFLQVK